MRIKTGGICNGGRCLSLIEETIYRKLLIQLMRESWYTLSVTSLRIWSVTGPFFSMMARIASCKPAIFPLSKSSETASCAGAAAGAEAVSEGVFAAGSVDEGCFVASAGSDLAVCGALGLL